VSDHADPNFESKAITQGTWGRLLGLIAAWAWTVVAGGGGLLLLLEKGPWPLTNGWFALLSGIAACPLYRGSWRNTRRSQSQAVFGLPPPLFCSSRGGLPWFTHNA
jgi:hypothetical protein